MLNRSFTRLIGAPLMTFLVFGGCASLPAHSPLPQGLQIVTAGRIDTYAPFAWRPDGRSFAYVRGKLILESTDSAEQSVIDSSPSAIAWSPDGLLLAAAAGQGADTLLRIHDMQGGVAGETSMAGHVTELHWLPGNEIIAPAISLKKLRFGSNLRIQLHRWKPGSPQVTTTLSDTTIMPARAHRDLKNYLESFSFALSPYGDEIAYTRFVEPPNFPSYMKIVVRQLGSGAEREAAGVKPSSAGACFSSDGEHLLYGDSTGSIRMLAPWTGDEQRVLDSPGRSIALSSSDRYLFADGRLYLEGRAIASFPSDCAAAFSPDGRRLLLRCGESLSLLSGLSRSTQSDPDPDSIKPLLELRKWRSEGLISDQEYQNSKQRILSQ